MSGDGDDEATTSSSLAVADDDADDVSVGSEVRERLSIWGYRGAFPPGPAMQQWNDAEPGSAKRFLEMMHESDDGHVRKCLPLARMANDGSLNGFVTLARHR